MGDPAVVVAQLTELRSEADAMGELAASRREAREAAPLVEVTAETLEVPQENVNGHPRPDILQWLGRLLGR